MVEKIKIGMTTKEVFNIIPSDKNHWDEYENGEYRYGFNYRNPNNYKKTFWIIIKNDKVINCYTI